MVINVKMTEKENGEYMGVTFNYTQQLYHKLKAGIITEEQYERYCDKLIAWEDVAHERTEWGA